MTTQATPDQARLLANGLFFPQGEQATVLRSLATQVEALTAYNATRTDELAASVAQCVALTAERDTLQAQLNQQRAMVEKCIEEMNRNADLGKLAEAERDAALALADGLVVWVSPIAGKGSDLPVEGCVILDKDMREWAQSHGLHLFFCDSWHVMKGKTWMTTGYESPKKALEACWEEGELDGNSLAPRPPQAERVPMTDADIVSLAYDCNALPEVITDETLLKFGRALLEAQKARDAA